MENRSNYEILKGFFIELRLDRVRGLGGLLDLEGVGKSDTVRRRLLVDNKR